MNISLESLFMQNNSIQGMQTAGQNTAANSAVIQILQNMFSTGDVISGKVTSMQGNAVELLLPTGQNINALLGQDVCVNVGEKMMFSVKGINSNQLELRPLFTNTANTSTIMKALEGAGLKVNEQNVTMVQNMMERGMSIQKEALLSVRRSMSSFPEVASEDVVTLHALKLPVTKENLTQLTAYKNSENQIMKPIQEMLSEIPGAFDTLISNGETSKAVSLYKDVIMLLGDMQQSTGKEVLDNVNLSGNSALLEDGVKEQVKHILSQFGMDEGQIEAFLNENPSKQTIMKTLSSQISNSPFLTEEKLSELFKDPVFKLFVKDTTDELSALAPKEIAQYENIDNLYENLHKRADKILKTLEGSEDLALAKSAQNLKSNVNFMNQINQMFQYVQLPIKFAEGKANGELYVYGNGKKLSLEDGNVSALLHLDMEHLGTVDIHVEMDSQKQVKTNFYFEDEAMLDFIYEHIDMLNERLEKRGYGPVTKVQMRDDATKTPVSEIFEKKEETPILLNTRSFDARI